jgi:hypothetical protein
MNIPTDISAFRKWCDDNHVKIAAREDGGNVIIEIPSGYLKCDTCKIDLDAELNLAKSFLTAQCRQCGKDCSSELGKPSMAIFLLGFVSTEKKLQGTV